MQYTDSLWSGLRYIGRRTPRQDAGGTNCIGEGATQRAEHSVERSAPCDHEARLPLRAS